MHLLDWLVECSAIVSEFDVRGPQVRPLELICRRKYKIVSNCYAHPGESCLVGKTAEPNME